MRSLSTMAETNQPGAARFEVLRTIGVGGMGSVFEVRNIASGEHLALKRLHAHVNGKRGQHLLELFEREFYTLSQIAHPNVVEVYDYGVDEQGAYYTMELLRGGELQQLAPRPMLEVCRIGRELCSALSLLHSRRLLFRDLSPRNVHRAADGHIKLIDFGAVMPMGLPRGVVGTPACCAPEAIDLQPLDARTDLYSLGATLYFALTGRHAVAARTFAEVRGMSSMQPARPAQLVADVSAPLEALLLELLQSNPQHRPSSAHEVMERLAAIEGRPLEESLQVSSAYLSMPNLVGRDAELGAIRDKLRRTVSGRGCSLLIDGAAGSGRTRLLTASSFDAKVLGALVVHADAASGDPDFGVARGLAGALLEQASELARDAASPALPVLAQLLPELLEGAPEIALRSFGDATERRAALLAALREWLLTISRKRMLVMMIDDLDRADEPSAALVALCANDAAQHALAVLATRETMSAASAPAALELFAGSASRVALPPLTVPNTVELVTSVFGEVPGAAGVARALHAIARGNPRDTMQLAQYLVDTRLAQYRSGAWSLPETFDGAQLPIDMANALRRQIAALSPAALELGRLISIAHDRPLRIGECVTACAELSTPVVHEALSELLRHRIVESVHDRYATMQRGLHAALCGALPAPEAQRLHRKVAELFARRGDEEFRRAAHLLRAGDGSSAVTVLATWATESQRLTDPDPIEFLKLVASMPHDWLDTYTTAITLCEQLGHPVSQLVELRSRLAALCDVLRVPSAITNQQLTALLRQLSRDCGVDAYFELDPQVPAMERLKVALGQAAARHQSDPTGARSLEPLLALKRLVRIQFLSAGVSVIALDLPFWSQLPALTPFGVLSPAIDVADKFVAAIGMRLAGRIEQALDSYLKLIERLDQPDRGGLDEAIHRFVRYGLAYGVGILEVGLGRTACLSWANEVEPEPLYRVNAFRIRMLNELWQGRTLQADALREQVELLRIESCPRTFQDGMHLFLQTVVHAVSDDLSRLKHIISEIEGMASWRPAWRPVLDYALGEYQRIRGDEESAAKHLSAALAATSPSTHQIWGYAAGAYTTILRLQRRAEEAVAFASESLRAAEQAQLGHTLHFIRMPLALALAETGAHGRARAIADEVIAELAAAGTSGITRCLAFDVGARIALHARDASTWDDLMRRYAEHAHAVDSAMLIAKYQRLARTARHASSTSGDVVEPLSASSTELSAFLDFQGDPSEFAARALDLLLRRSGASSGCLYWVSATGPVLAAQAGETQSSDEAARHALATSISEFIAAELEVNDVDTQDTEVGEHHSDRARTWARSIDGLHRLVLMYHSTREGPAVTGVAALRVEEGVAFIHPAELATRLSELAAVAGVVVPIANGEASFVHS